MTDTGLSSCNVTQGGRTVRTTKRRMTHEEQAKFAEVSARFIAAKLAEEAATGVPSMVTKDQIIYVLGPGYSRARVDQLRKNDPGFPVPVDSDAYILRWKFRELLEYQRRKFNL